MHIIITLIGLLTVSSLLTPEWYGIIANNENTNLRLWLLAGLWVVTAIHVNLARSKALRQDLSGELANEKSAHARAQQQIAQLSKQKDELIDQNSSTSTHLEAQIAELQHELTQWKQTKQRLAEEQQKRSEAQEQVLAAQKERDTWHQAFDDQNVQIKRLQKEMTSIKEGQSRQSEAASLLRLLQENGHFLDFVMEDASQISDSDLAAASRLVHQGCQQVIKQYFDVTPVSDQAEGQEVKIDPPVDGVGIKLIGAARDDGPYQGTLVHRGWQTRKINLPEAQSPKSGSHILSPMEIELA